METKMNERIRAIADEAYKHALDGYSRWSSDSTFDGVPHIRNLYTEKFAQLIIQECATLTLDHRSDDYYQGWLDYRDEIRQHFGVEQ
jgi:hypothetical protein